MIRPNTKKECGVRSRSRKEVRSSIRSRSEKKVGVTTEEYRVRK